MVVLGAARLRLYKKEQPTELLLYYYLVVGPFIW